MEQTPNGNRMVGGCAAPGASAGLSGCCVTYALHCNTLTQSNTVAPKKSATLNLRIDPAIKEAVREAAIRDNRSVANMVEVLIRRHCDQTGITIPEQSDLFPRNENG